jgi:hypothetical protein
MAITFREMAIYIFEIAIPSILKTTPVLLIAISILEIAIAFFLKTISPNCVSTPLFLEWTSPDRKTIPRFLKAIPIERKAIYRFRKTISKIEIATSFWRSRPLSFSKPPLRIAF